ncbi:hypothetical protein [Neisseria gonorrhoeae]|uniref:hypothetical protein n=1 Tax=Neisseria gonorrhoeae TaxID=485 RepID=UPI001E4AB0FD|nr:hypothetical protein [Neisseria gonorrhoeae]MCC9010792.1 hypothetical protein [Neisseria gonorrhoeae]
MTAAPGKSKHTMHGFRDLFANISLTAGKDTLTTDLALTTSAAPPSNAQASQACTTT